MTGRPMGIVLVVLAVVAAGAWILFPHGRKPRPATQPTNQWLTSTTQAAQEARASGKFILADFTGSDWCPWCWKLDSEIFDSPQFRAWAAQNVILLQVDFPRRKKQDEALARQNQGLLNRYGVEGFPTVLFLRPDGAPVGRLGYDDAGPGVWIDNAQKILDRARNGEPRSATSATAPAISP